MFGVRVRRVGVVAVVAGGVLTMGGARTPADVGIDVAGRATVTEVDGATTLDYSRSVEGVVWRLEVEAGGSNSALAESVMAQLDAAGCERRSSIHGHGAGEDGRFEHTIAANHVSCDAADVEVGWTTGRTVVWVVVGDARH